VKSTVPVFTCTDPVLLKMGSTLLLFVPELFFKVPALLNVPPPVLT
jgi:hypothetical protein